MIWPLAYKSSSVQNQFSELASRISKIFSTSASVALDFLRLVRSWLRIVAASGVNFWECSAARAEFWLSEDRFPLISFRSARSVSKLWSKLYTDRDQRLQFQVAIEPLHRSRSAPSVSNWTNLTSASAISINGCKVLINHLYKWLDRRDMFPNTSF